MFKVLWSVTTFERWLLVLIGVILLMHYGIITTTFDALLIGVITLGSIILIRIIAKGIWLNGDVK